jgi:hypothetical protein
MGLAVEMGFDVTYRRRSGRDCLCVYHLVVDHILEVMNADADTRLYRCCCC